MITVSQQSDGISVILHTSSSKFSDNVSLYKIDILEKKI